MRLVGVDAVDVGAAGPAGDRAFHVRGADGKAALTTRHPKLVQIVPAWDAGARELTLTFPDGTGSRRRSSPAPRSPPRSTTAAPSPAGWSKGRSRPRSRSTSVRGSTSSPATGRGGRRRRLPGDADVAGLARRPGGALGDDALDGRRFRMTIIDRGRRGLGRARLGGREVAVGDAVLRVAEPTPRASSRRATPTAAGATRPCSRRWPICAARTTSPSASGATSWPRAGSASATLRSSRRPADEKLMGSLRARLLSWPVLLAVLAVAVRPGVLVQRSSGESLTPVDEAFAKVCRATAARRRSPPGSGDYVKDARGCTIEYGGDSYEMYAVHPEGFSGREAAQARRACTMLARQKRAEAARGDVVGSDARGVAPARRDLRVAALVAAAGHVPVEERVDAPQGVGRRRLRGSRARRRGRQLGNRPRGVEQRVRRARGTPSTSCSTPLAASAASSFAAAPRSMRSRPAVGRRPPGRRRAGALARVARHDAVVHRRRREAAATARPAGRSRRPCRTRSRRRGRSRPRARRAPRGRPRSRRTPAPSASPAPGRRRGRRPPSAAGTRTGRARARRSPRAAKRSACRGCRREAEQLVQDDDARPRPVARGQREVRARPRRRACAASCPASRRVAPTCSGRRTPGW